MEAVKNPNKNIEMRPISSEILSPKEYMRLQENKAGSIKSVEFIRPRLGDNHFGKFQVTYKHPIFKQIEQRK